MRQDNCLEERMDYLTLLDSLRRTDFINESATTSALLNNPLVDGYFDRNLGEDRAKDASFEKCVAVAAAKAYAKVNGEDEKQMMAAANEAVDLLHDARLLKLLHDGRITEATYELYKKAQKSSFIRGKVKTLIKRFGIDRGISWILSKVPIPHPAVIAAQVAYQVWSILPQPVKEKCKAAAIKVSDKVIKKIPEVTKKLWDKGKKVVKTSAKVIEKGISIAQQAGRLVKETATAAVKTTVQVGTAVARTAVKAGSSLVRGAVSTVTSVARSVGSAVSSGIRAVAGWFHF